MRPREDERCTKLVVSARVGYMGEHIGVRWGVGDRGGGGAYSGGAYCTI